MEKDVVAVREHLLHRFNLELDADLEALEEEPIAGAVPTPASAARAFGLYLRGLLKPRRFYQFSALNYKQFLLVASNKSQPGREVPDEGELEGRPCVVAWFERVELSSEGPEGVVVRPVGAVGDAGELQLITSNIAEISMAAGFHPPSAANATARDTELLHEETFLSHDILVWDSERVGSGHTDEVQHWTFVLSAPRDIEDEFFATTPTAEYTKIALCRLLQRRDGSSADTRAQRWRHNRQVLLDAVGGAPLPDEVGVGDGGGKGRGKGKGKGRGKGN